MSSNSGELMFNRLIVLLQIIFIPIYFIYFNLRWNDEIESFFKDNDLLNKILPDWLIWFEVNLAIPIFFSLPWVLITLIRATRIADSYTLMGRALGKVRIDQKLFYGINATFTLVFLILPFLSPLITIIGIFILFRIISHKILIGKLSKFIWFIPALIIAIIPGLIAFAFYSNYVVLFDEIFEIWKNSIDPMFGIGLCMAIAITIGNFLSFLSERNIRNSRKNINPFRLIYVIKFIAFAFFLFIFFNFPISVINTINIFAAIIAFTEIIFRRISDLPSDSSGANFMVFAFIILQFITRFVKNFITVDIFRAMIIVISGLVFFVLFLISYKYAEDEELISRA